MAYGVSTAFEKAPFGSISSSRERKLIEVQCCYLRSGARQVHILTGDSPPRWRASCPQLQACPAFPIPVCLQNAPVS